VRSARSIGVKETLKSESIQALCRLIAVTGKEPEARMATRKKRSCRSARQEGSKKRKIQKRRAATWRETGQIYAGRREVLGSGRDTGRDISVCANSAT
jgi:hypothetical protein